MKETRGNSHALQKFISAKCLRVKSIKKSFRSIVLHRGGRYGKPLVCMNLLERWQKLYNQDVGIVCLCECTKNTDVYFKNESYNISI